MYSYISGVLSYRGTDHVVIEAGGIGYKISTSLTSLDTLPQQGVSVKFFTHLHVREDAMLLFGFVTQEELNVFELLISVSGVGPKAALSILSAVSPSKFGLSIIMGDVKSLTKAQGVGSKLAQRIILELKDKIKSEQDAQGAIGIDEAVDINGDLHIAEAISALIVLGYTPVEARSAVSKVTGIGGADDVESVIKKALMGMGGK